MFHEVLQSASLRLETPISTQLRDGFIRPRSFPSHRLLPPLSKLSFGLTMPPQAGVRLPQTHIVFLFGYHTLGDLFLLLATSGVEGYLRLRSMANTWHTSEELLSNFFDRFCLAEKQQTYCTSIKSLI